MAKTKSVEKQLQTQNEIRKLEEIYVNGNFDLMMEDINKKKEELVQNMIEYAESHTKETKWDKDGNPLAYKVDYNPIVVSNNYFKPIIPINCHEPLYNAEKLSMVYDYYCDLLAEINDKIGYLPSSLTSFCKLAGITSTTLRNYRNSSDLNMRIIADKIYDQIGDENLTMSQLGKVSERSTIFKLKSQNEMIEKEQPKVTINITEKPDLERINERLSKYSQYTDKKGK